MWVQWETLDNDLGHRVHLRQTSEGCKLPSTNHDRNNLYTCNIVILLFIVLVPVLWVVLIIVDQLLNTLCLHINFLVPAPHAPNNKWT